MKDMLKMDSSMVKENTAIFCKAMHTLEDSQRIKKQDLECSLHSQRSNITKIYILPNTISLTKQTFIFEIKI